MKSVYMTLLNKTSCILLLSVLIASCGTSNKGLFTSNKPMHEKYGDKLTNSGLHQTQLGGLWFAAAGHSLNQPVSITLPYKETGYFAADKPAAAGYIFNLRRGEQLQLSVNITPASSVQFFAELWQATEPVGNFKLLTAADTVTRQLKYEAEKDGRYIIRLQPELLRGVEYTMSLVTAPSLAYPVSEIGKPRLISPWGVGRDGGARSHEGIDIGAPRGTPLLAVAKGYVNRVGENNLGGKIVFLRPADKNYSVYYAHLDKQIAVEGQQVNVGDTIGLVGNTGNARTTAPHLHFGIYTNGGAIDPLPFVNRDRAAPASTSAPLHYLDSTVRSLPNAFLYETASSKSIEKTKLSEQVFSVIAATGNMYKVVLPHGKSGFVNAKDVTGKPLRNFRVKDSTRLLDEPLIGAAAKATIAAQSEVAIIGAHENFYLVKYKDVNGWINK